MVRFKVYVHSSEIPAVRFADDRDANHSWPKTQKTSLAYLMNVSERARQVGQFKDRFLSDGDKEALARVDDFCRKTASEYEIVDIGTMKFMARLGSRIRGIKTPAICFAGKMLHGIPSDEDIKALLKD